MAPLHLRFIAAALGFGIIGGCTRTQRPFSAPSGDAVVSSIRPVRDSTDDLGVLRRAIGARRIVLLGENGHGVGQFSALKVRIIRDLHERLGFDVVALESGYHDCREADERLVSQDPVKSFRDCLAYAFEHAEALPLFQYAREVRRAGVSFTIAGVDLQTQGATTTTRPARIRNALRTDAPELADAVASADSSLIRAATAGGDTLRRWLRQSGLESLALFDTATTRTSGDARWTIAGAAALLRRLQLRDVAEQRGDSTPATFYGSRDEWMARTISWLADSTGRARKVVVWLHNDHARLGEWMSPSGPVTATGALLRQRYPNDVVSVGFFMGHGSVANNSRAVRPMIPMPPDGIEAPFERAGWPTGFLDLARPSNATVAGWGRAMRPYLRNGLTLDSLRPSREFDALFYIDRVTPPSYRIP